MFDYFRELGQSADEKRNVLINAYLDNALSAKERDQLEAQLRQDPALRADMERVRLVKQQLLAMPRRRVPRSFSLDPALYGPPKPQRSQQMYPVLRGATALVALLFVFVLGLSQVNLGGVGDGFPAEAVSMATSSETELAAAPEESAAADLAPEAAEAAMVMEEPAVGGAAESTAADAGASEQLADEAANAVAPMEESLSLSDDTMTKESEATGESLDTAATARLESSDEADQPPGVTSETGNTNQPEAAPSPQPALPYATIALWLGIATLALGLVTLLLRGRSQI